MENTKQKLAEEQNVAEEVSGKAVRISLEHRALLDKGRGEINSDATYTKKISYTRYIEKLIEQYWDKPIEELKKEREGSEDWLKMKHKREAPDMSLYDWMRAQLEEKQKKSMKSNKGEKK